MISHIVLMFAFVAVVSGTKITIELPPSTITASVDLSPFAVVVTVFLVLSDMLSLVNPLDAH